MCTFLVLLSYLIKEVSQVLGELQNLLNLFARGESRMSTRASYATFKLPLSFWKKWALSFHKCVASSCGLWPPCQSVAICILSAPPSVHSCTNCTLLLSFPVADVHHVRLKRRWTFTSWEDPVGSGCPKVPPSRRDGQSSLPLPHHTRPRPDPASFFLLTIVTTVPQDSAPSYHLPGIKDPAERRQLCCWCALEDHSKELRREGHGCMLGHCMQALV